MNTLLTVIIVVQVLSALIIIGLVLLQHGKGADMGAAFGSGASGSLFGASGSSNFLSKFTALAAAVFFAATLALAFFGSKRPAVTGGIMDNLPAVPTAPAKASAPAVNSPAAPATKSDARQSTQGSTADGGGQSNQIPK